MKSNKPVVRLKGAEGDAIHAVQCAAGYNIRWLLRMIRNKGIRPYLTLIKLPGLSVLLAENASTNRIALFKRGRPTVSNTIAFSAS